MRSFPSFLYRISNSPGPFYCGLLGFRIEYQRPEENFLFLLKSVN